LYFDVVLFKFYVLDVLLLEMCFVNLFFNINTTTNNNNMHSLCMFFCVFLDRTVEPEES